MPDLAESIDCKIKWVRILIGTYILALLLRVYLDADFLYSINGVSGPTFFRYTELFFPFDISFLFTAINLQILFICAFIFAALLTIGFAIRISSVFLFFTFFLLHYRNPYSLGFYTQFMGWTLILLVIWPRRNQASDYWIKYRQLLIVGAQIILATCYLTSGLAKLARPEWISGEALVYFVDLPFLRNATWISSMPLWAIKVGTWGALLVEILFLPLFLVPATRLFAWTIATLFQFSILIAFNIPFVTLVILIFHILAMQQSWFDKSYRIGRKLNKWL